MPPPEAGAAMPVRYRHAPLARSPLSCERRADGTLILRALDPAVETPAMGFSAYVEQWSRLLGDGVAFAQRVSAGSWRSISWAGFHAQMLAAAARLLALRGERAGPLMILSGNSIEQAVLTLAAEYAGIPVAPISPNYAMQGPGFTKLRAVTHLLEPALVFAQSGATFALALDAIASSCGSVVTVDDVQPGQVPWQELGAGGVPRDEASRLARARAAITPRATARIFFTSGSTGAPKGVPLSYDVLSRSSAQALYMHRDMPREPLVMLDWLPWSHAFAGLGNLGRLFTLGGSYFIDDGRPLAGQFQRTLENLREVEPTVYATVPAAWAQLSTALASDAQLAQAFFRRLRYVSYGGASLPRDVWERIQTVARRTIGEQIVFTSGFGSTETAATGISYNRPAEDVGNVGTPNPGVEAKLVPLEGGDSRYEVRMRGRNVFAGYLQAPDLTREAFDEEGFYRLGDAVVLADAANPEAGMRYAGRCVEDFKLTTGTWVRVGSMRLALIERCSPLLTDAVICGQDEDFVAALAWCNVAACRLLDPLLAQLPADELVAHPVVVAALRERLRTQQGGSSQCIRRLLLLAQPPSLDDGEIADKGYINQAVTRSRREAQVRQLFAAHPGPAVAALG